MAPAMKRLLTEGAELLHQDSNSVDRLMLYVDNNLATLHEYLNEDNFNRILEIVWETLGQILHDLLQSNLDVRLLFLKAIVKIIVLCFCFYRIDDHHLSLQISMKH